MTGKIPRKNNVTSITKAISKMKDKPRLGDVKMQKKRKQRQQNPIMKEPKLPGKDLSVFPDIPGLTEEKTIIGKGMIALNKALFEQTIHESERLAKIRKILTGIEVDLLDESSIDRLSPEQKLRIFETLRRDSEVTVNFLERMQRNSLQIMLVFQIYKQLLDTMEDSEKDKPSGLPADVDKSRVLEVRGALLEFMSKAK